MKKRYYIEVYELHCATFECEAENEEEAIGMFEAGRADYVDDSSDFIEIAEKYQGTREDGTEFPSGIRNVEVVKEPNIENARQIEESDILSEIKEITK